MSCFKFSFPCVKFLLAAILSIAVMAFSITMLAIDRFKECNTTTFCTTAIMTILAFWMKAPSAVDKKKIPQDNEI